MREEKPKAGPGSGENERCCDEKAPGGFRAESSCGTMMARMMKTCCESVGEGEAASEPGGSGFADACGPMVARMMKACYESSRVEGETAAGP